MRRVVTPTAAVLAAVVLSGCGSSGGALSSAPQLTTHGSGDIVFVAGGPSASFGVDNTDLLATTSSGHVRDLTSSPAAESNAAWSADGSHVVFIRQSTIGRKNGAVASQAGVYVWSPGHGSPQRIASCSRFCEETDFAWSPNDRQIAYVSYKDGIDVMSADGTGIHTVCDYKRCGQGLGGPVAWSPDGRSLVFANSGSPLGPYDPPSSIWIANADGSGVTRLTQPNCGSFLEAQRNHCARDTAPAWSPDGRMIAFSRWELPSARTTGAPSGTAAATGPTHPVTTSLEVMRADGSHVRSIYNCHAGDWCSQVLPPAWSPDGKAIAYAPTVSRAPATLRITTLQGKTTTLHPCAGSRCLSPDELVWSPSGQQLAFVAGGTVTAPDVWVIGHDGAGLHRVGVGAQCYCLTWVRHVSLSGAKTVPTVPTTGHPHLSGTILYDDPSDGPDSQLHVLTLGGGLHPRDGGLGLGLEPTWSPDSSRIAFGATRATPNTNIYVADRDGGNVHVLTHFRHGATQPAWSPDGRTIAFAGEGGIGLVPAAGGEVRSLFSKGVEPSWSPNGRQLVFASSLGGQHEALFTIRPDGGGLRRITKLPGEQRSPTWSPNGKEIAFEWWTLGGEALYLIRPDGTHLRRATSAAVPQGKPAWSPDSRYLLVMDQYGAPTGTLVSVIDVTSGRMATVGTLPGYAADPSWSR